jgi:hypothetical protein
LVRHIINSLNGSYVVVTADHGFLYESANPDATDKSVLDSRPTGTVVAKKRYLLGYNLPPADNVHRGATSVTANADGDMQFWVPRGTNRFHFSGGAKFFHGGAMPQEIVVPVIVVREREGDAAEATRARPATVHVLGSNFKITTNRHRFQLMQTEPVSDRVKPVTLLVAIYDGGTPITSVESVTFDSTSDNMNDRTKTVTLSLKSQAYDKRRQYPLILRNAEDQIEMQRIDTTIDLVFSNDF